MHLVSTVEEPFCYHSALSPIFLCSLVTQGVLVRETKRKFLSSSSSWAKTLLNYKLTELSCTFKELQHEVNHHSCITVGAGLYQSSWVILSSYSLLNSHKTHTERSSPKLQNDVVEWIESEAGSWFISRLTETARTTERLPAITAPSKPTQPLMILSIFMESSKTWSHTFHIPQNSRCV